MSPFMAAGLALQREFGGVYDGVTVPPQHIDYFLGLFTLVVRANMRVERRSSSFIKLVCPGCGNAQVILSRNRNASRDDSWTVTRCVTVHSACKNHEQCVQGSVCKVVGVAGLQECQQNFKMGSKLISALEENKFVASREDLTHYHVALTSLRGGAGGDVGAGNVEEEEQNCDCSEEECGPAPTGCGGGRVTRSMSTRSSA